MKHFKTSDGLNLAYSDEGQGIPVLCLAGLTRNSTDFNY
ncbi:MAG: alpha/beta hydrolase, partial [Amylibacter sp.]